MGQKMKKSLLCILLLTFAALSAVAQTPTAPQATTSTGQISGVVKDPDQAVLAGAHVTVTNSVTKAKVEADTDSQGAYSFPSLPPGSYVVEADAKGFQHGASSQLNVAAGQSVNADLVSGSGRERRCRSTSRQTARMPTAWTTWRRADRWATCRSSNQPYAVYVIPRQLIDDTQSRNFDEIAKYMPLMTFREQQGPEILRPEARGMQGTNMQNDRKDGMGFAVTTPTALEEYEQLEVFTGLGGELYGPTQPVGHLQLRDQAPHRGTVPRNRAGL